jgi:adenine C2-methylase RlmN of 23S rRNA A2503 and tRNA A37
MNPSAGSATVARSLDRLAGNQTASLQGALNTIQNQARTMTPREEPNIDFSQLTTAMQDVLVRGFKSQEDVIKELREPLERVAVASAESVNVQNRVRKGIKGMSGDIMRGIG